MNFLADNQFAAGLLATTILAAVLAYMRNVPQKLMVYFWTQFAVSVEIKNSDPAFGWLAIWLDHQPYSKNARRLSVYTHTKDTDEELIEEEAPRRKKNRPRVLFTPAPGEHLFWYKRKLIWLSHTKDAASTPGAAPSSPALDRESFHIWVFGRNQTTIREIIHDAMTLALPEGVPETCVIPSSDGRWQAAIRRRPRSRNSVILEGGAIDNLIADAKHFLKNKMWYDDLGIPYRRGYLLHGIPGAGKTSAVLAVAGELGLDVYMLNLGDRYLDDGRLNYLLAQVPPGNIVLLEDIDATFQTREKKPEPRVLSKEMSSEVTFSGLLNALDGVAAREGRLLFMKTNYRAILDTALVRPGRADVHLEFGYATKRQAERMFTRFFPTVDPSMALQFGDMTPTDRVSMAVIQDHLLTNKNDPMAAILGWVTSNQHD